MGCSACQKRRQQREQMVKSNPKLAVPSKNVAGHMSYGKTPLNVRDIKVYEDGEIVEYDWTKHWKDGYIKLLLFYPEDDTGVCETEMGALNKYLDKFEELKVQVIASSTDSVQSHLDWFTTTDILKDAKYPVFSTRQLPQKLTIMKGNRNKRASVWFLEDGSNVLQECLHSANDKVQVGRSIEELLRQAYGFRTDSYCAEGFDPNKVSFKNYKGVLVNE